MISSESIFFSLIFLTFSFSIFSSFEDFTAKKFSFEHLDKNDFEKEMFYSGYVQKNKKNTEKPSVQTRPAILAPPPRARHKKKKK